MVKKNKKITQIPTREEQEMDPDKIMDSLSTELSSALKAMAKAKTVEEKAAYSKIIKNLTESLGVFLNLASDMMAFDYEDEC